MRSRQTIDWCFATMLRLPCRDQRCHEEDFDAEDQTVRENIATAYFNLGKLLENHGHGEGAKAFHKNLEKSGGESFQS